jgi:hypothetical protein
VRRWHCLLALALAQVLGAAPSTACSAGFQTYFSYSRLQPVDGTVNIRVRVTEIRGRVVLAELEGPFARLSDDGNVRILLPTAPDNFGCEELGPIQGLVFVRGTPVRDASGRLTLEAAPSRPVWFRHVRSLDHYDQYIVDPAWRSDASSPAPPR